MRIPQALVVILTLSLLTSTPSTAADRVVQSNAEGSPLALVVTPQTTRIEVLGRTTHAVTVPSGAELSSIAPLGEDWIAAGVWRRDDLDEVLLITNQGGVTKRWTGPLGAKAPSLMAPTLLSDSAGGLLLAWLEGSDVTSMTVRASWFEGGRWSEPQQVAAAAVGSQMALTGAVLQDGSRLLLWSRFDGRDDEIFWSRGDAAGWSSPRPIAADNTVPDVLPAVIATGSGAMAAWSRYDGEDYRLLIARFVDGEWTPPRSIGGRGSLYPSFTSRDGLPQLLYSETAASAWALVGLDGEGRPARQTVVSGDPHERPLIVRTDEDKATLRWTRTGIERQSRWSVVP